MRLVCAGAGPRWDRGFASDGVRLWRLADGVGVHLPGVVQVYGDVAVTASRWHRFGDGASGVGWPLPVRLWDEDGFLFRTGDRTEAVDVLRRRERYAAGPHGAVVVGRDTWDRAAAPGRGVQPLPVELVPGTERWSADGSAVRGMVDDGEGVTVDLRTGRITARWAPEPVLVGSWALSGARLAGPGGRVWLLGEERPLSAPGSIPLGVAIAAPHGFVVADWETNEGWTVPHGAEPADRFALPIPPDDTPLAGCWDGDAAWITTAEGLLVRVVGAEAVVVDDGPEVPDPPDPLALDTPLGSLLASGAARVGETVYVWDEDGWLWAGAPSTFGGGVMPGTVIS